MNIKKTIIMLAVILPILFLRLNLVFGESSVIEVCLSVPYQHAWDCPYSVVWYGIAMLIPHNTFQTWADSLAFIDAIIMVIIGRLFKTTTFIAYSVFSFSAFLAPYNLIIVWLTLLGFINSKLLIVPILVKLPLGSEFFVGLTEWKFIFSSSLQHPYAYIWYGVIGSWWLVVLFRKEFGLVTTVNQRVIQTDMQPP